MVLFFTSMFSTVSIYRLPCKTISGLWFGLPAIGRARPVLCHTSREGVVSEGGAHGERVLRSDRPPGNAAPHHSAARAQMQPVSRSSRRWPRAPSSMPPSSPEEHLSPPPAPSPPSVCSCHHSRPGSAHMGSAQRCSRSTRAGMASSLPTSALKGRILDCSFRTKSVKNNCQERVRGPFRIQLIPKGKGAGPGAAGRPCAVKVGI